MDSGNEVSLFIKIAVNDKNVHIINVLFLFDVLTNMILYIFLHQNNANKNQMAPIIGILGSIDDALLGTPAPYKVAIIHLVTQSVDVAIDNMR